jgi:hypothetical protein
MLEHTDFTNVFFGMPRTGYEVFYMPEEEEY